MAALSAWPANVVSCMRREMAAWCQSPGEVFFCGWVPVLWVLVVWAFLGQGVMTRIPVAFVDEDRSQLSREVARAVAANRSFGLVHFESRQAAMSAMRGGSVYAVIAVPFSYSRDMLRGAGSSVCLYLDENRYAVAGTLQAEFGSVMNALGDERLFRAALGMGDGTGGASRTVRVVHSSFYALGNMQFSFLAFLGGALIPGVIMVGAMLAFVTALLREDWNGGNGDWLESAGGSASAALTGKMLPHFALFCLVFLFYMALFCGQGGFAPAGSLIVWFACGCACLAVFSAMAVLITAIAPNWRSALVVASGYAAPALPFTGFSIPLDSMGKYVQAFAQCLPLTWLVQGQSQQWTLGSGVAETGHTFMAFGLLFAIPSLIGFPFFRRKLLRKAAAQGRGSAA